MGAVLQFVLLFVCWLSALATLLVFLETWFGLAGRNRFIAQRASGAYGVISVFVPMYGSPEKIKRTLLSVFNQSYPFIELVLIYCEENRALAQIAKEFRGSRSHIPVRVVPTLFSIVSHNDRIRALEHAQSAARGRWFVILDPDVSLDRFAIETAVEFAGCNEVSALALHPGIRCRSLVQEIIAPSMEQLLQMGRIVSLRREKQKKAEFDSSFLIVNREAFEVVNRINRMPGILNESGWNLWAYQVEGLRTFQADGSRWIWRSADVRSWSSDTNVQRRYGTTSAGFIVASAAISLLSVLGVAFGFVHGIDNFFGASILAFAGVSYLLMWVSYFLFARRLHAAVWFAPLWIFSHMPAAVLTLMELRRSSKLKAGIGHKEAQKTQKEFFL
jgi:glycosyltransferase involved in cell wall biosynthesis